jgi:periplasmic mercuric ion binding protein
MKTLKFLLITIFTALIISNCSFAQISKTVTVKIQTSAQCEMCKERIEKALVYENGVKNADLDLETKIVTVIYNPKKTTVENLKQAISYVGYDADDIEANIEAYDALPPCCKKNAMDVH